MAGRKIRDAADARASLSASARSELSRVEWARHHGIDGRSLNAWCLNLARRNRSRAEPRPVRLVELVPTATARPTTGRYLVRCGDLEVEVDGGFDDGTLARLLRVVASC